MASDNEASCVSDPNFAVICSFLECFGKSCGINYPDIARLQEMLEDTQEVPQQLVELHIKLLRKLRKTVSPEKWERALVKFCHTYSNQDGWELERFGYKKARIGVKLRLLKVLLEAQFDLNARFKLEVNKLAADQLRVEPLGRDKTGLTYWFQLDEECNIRVYREDLDEENWELVAQDREGVVNLINLLSDGEGELIPVNEDSSNSMGISEKPIIDTGQVAECALPADEKKPENGTTKEEKMEQEQEVASVTVPNNQEVETEKERIENTVQNVNENKEVEEQVEDEEEEEEEEGEGDEEDEEVSNDESSEANSDENDEEEEEEEEDEEEEDEEDSQEASEIKNQAPQSVIPPKLVENKAPLMTIQAKNVVEKEAPRTPWKVSISEVNNEVVPISGEAVQIPKPIAAKANALDSTIQVKAIETPVITTSPLKLINIHELQNPAVVDRGLQREEKYSVKSALPFQASESTSIHPKFPVKPIDKLAANLSRIQSEKLEKPGAAKLLEKIAENLARSSGAQGATLVNGDDDKVQELINRGGSEKSNLSIMPARSQRGMNLSTSPRGWESSNDHARPMDYSGIDLSSRKISKPGADIHPPSGAYRPQDFQHREMDLSTRKIGKPESTGLPYDSRSVILRNHTMVTDLSKKQMYPGYEMPQAGAYHSSPRISGKEEHRLPNYTILPDPSKIASMRMNSGPLKRSMDMGEDPQQEMLKRMRTEGLPLRGTMDKRLTPIMNSSRRDDIVGPAIEEPVMMVRGEGSGSDCDAVNPIIGEAIEEQVVFFYGDGTGRECDTGNPGDDTSSENKESNESKNEGCSDVTTSLTPTKIVNPEGSVNEATSGEDKSLPPRINANCSQSSNPSGTIDNCQSTVVSSVSPKAKFKPTLGVQVIPRTGTSSGSGGVKKTSRWDVGRPEDKTECDSSIVSSGENISTPNETLNVADHHRTMGNDRLSMSDDHVPRQSETDDITSTSNQTPASSIVAECSSSVGDVENITDTIQTLSTQPDSSLSTETSTSTGNDYESKETEASEKLHCDSSVAPSVATSSVDVVQSVVSTVKEDFNTDEEKVCSPEPAEEKNDPTADSPPRFFFGPNCVSYSSKTEEETPSSEAPSTSDSKPEIEKLVSDNNNLAEIEEPQNPESSDTSRERKSPEIANEKPEAQPLYKIEEATIPSVSTVQSSTCPETVDEVECPSVPMDISILRDEKEEKIDASEQMEVSESNNPEESESQRKSNEALISAVEKTTEDSQPSTVVRSELGTIESSTDDPPRDESAMVIDSELSSSTPLLETVAKVDSPKKDDANAENKIVPPREINEADESRAESTNLTSDSSDQLAETTFEEAASSTLQVTPDDSTQTNETSDEKPYGAKELELSSDLDDKTKQSLDSEDDSCAMRVVKMNEENANNELCNEDAQDGFSKSSEIPEETKESVEPSDNIVQVGHTGRMHEERSQTSVQLPEDSSGDSIALSYSSLAVNPSEDSTTSGICEASSLPGNPESMEKEEIHEKVTPAPIVDSNIAKSPERITIESKKASSSTGLLQAVDSYTDDLSENQSSADQDSNEAMVIDDRTSDSTESVKDAKVDKAAPSAVETLNFVDKVSAPITSNEKTDEDIEAPLSTESSEVPACGASSAEPSENLEKTEDKEQSLNNETQPILVDPNLSGIQVSENNDVLPGLLKPEENPPVAPEALKNEDTKNNVTEIVEEKSSTVQPSLVPNYVCSDDDDVSDEVFEPETGELEVSSKKIDEESPVAIEDEISRLTVVVGNVEASEPKSSESKISSELEDKFPAGKSDVNICENSRDYSEPEFDNAETHEQTHPKIEASTKNIDVENKREIDEKLNIPGERLGTNDDTKETGVSEVSLENVQETDVKSDELIAEVVNEDVPKESACLEIARETQDPVTDCDEMSKTSSTFDTTAKDDDQGSKSIEFSNKESLEDISKLESIPSISVDAIEKIDELSTSESPMTNCESEGVTEKSIESEKKVDRSVVSGILESATDVADSLHDQSSLEISKGNQQHLTETSLIEKQDIADIPALPEFPTQPIEAKIIDEVVPAETRQAAEASELSVVTAPTLKTLADVPSEKSNESNFVNKVPVSIVSEKIDEVLSAKNEPKKEASKRLHGVSDSEDFPPTKSKPPSDDFDNELTTRHSIEEKSIAIDYSKLVESPAIPTTTVTALTTSSVTVDEKLASKTVEPPMEIMQKVTNHEVPKILGNCAESTPLEQKSSEIQSIDVKCVDLESDDSMGIDSQTIFEAPAEDVDPLACEEDDFSKRTNSEEASIPKIGIRVKPVADLVYEGWKLDSPDPPAAQIASRKRRNSAYESNSEEGTTKQEDDGETGGKRMKLRGKRSPDLQLRKSVEANRPEALTSEDEGPKDVTPVETIDIKDDDDEVIEIETTRNDKKPRGRPRGRRRRGNRSFPKPAARSKINTEKLSEENSENLATLPVTDSTDVGQTESKKKRKKRKMVLGLEIGIDIAVPESQGGPGVDEIPVRQSRRIAQLKIKEEADKRRIEEETLSDMRDNKKDRDGTEKKKRKKQKAESEDDAIIVKEVEREVKSRKRKKKKMLSTFNEAKPWQSSSGSSSDEEGQEEEDEEEIESEGSLLFKSDHEFSPESDLEKDEESEPLRRARTAKAGPSDVEDPEDEYACQKCGKADHPEWILLCDTCDQGWHCSCLRPALMLIPEGDWFCPPCQHYILVKKLRESLKTFDQNSKKHENEVLRKKRLAFVGISLDNVLKGERAGDSSRGSSEQSDNDSSSSSSGSSSSSSSSEESEPVYQLRERRCANTYKFNEYDDMINAAIQDEVEALQGAGNQGRGKDIATIVNAEKEEAQAEALKSREHDEDDDEDGKKSEKDSDEDYKIDKEEIDEEEEDHARKLSNKKMLSRKKHRKLNSLDISSEDDPESDEDFKGSSSEEEEDFDDQLESSDDSFAMNKRRGRKGESRPVRRSTRAARTRYDADFVNDDSEDSDRPKRKKSRSIWEGSESEESDNSWRQRKKKSRTIPAPRIRATSKSKSRKKKKRKRIIESDNLSDNDEEEAEEMNEVEAVHVEHQPLVEANEEEFKNNEQVSMKKIHEEELLQDGETKYEATNIEEENPKKKKKETTPRVKKAPGIRRKIIYGGLDNDGPRQEEETLARRTRGRKINYQDIMGSDSEEELNKVLRKTEESEDEFVVNEGEEFNEDVEKDSDSGDIYSPKKDIPKGKAKSPKNKKMKKSPAGSKTPTDNGTPKQRKKPGPKPGSKNKPRDQQVLAISPSAKPNDTDSVSRGLDMEGSTMSATGSVIGEVPEGSLTGLTADDINALDDEQIEQMMMEDEEYGRRQLELAAIEIAKNKKQEEKEAKKLEKARLKALEILAAEQQRDPNAPDGTDGEIPKKKKRGRRSKAEILAEQMRRDGVPSLLTGVPTILQPSLIPDVSPSHVSPNVVTSPALPTIVAAPVEIERSPGAQIPLMAGPDGQLFSPDGSPLKPKRRGRGKGSSTSGSAPPTPPTSSVVPSQGLPLAQSPNQQQHPPPQQPTVYPTLPPSQQSSVITRMLQSQPVSSTPQSFTAAAAAMGHKYFGGPNAAGQMMAGPRPSNYDMPPRGRIPSPYRQSGPSSMPHFAAVRSGTPPMRMRVPGPQMYHTPHHPMDPSPSGGGPISINSRDRSSPLGPVPAMIPPAAGSPLAKGGPTPPPPPYVRGGPAHSRFADNPQLGPRHQIPQFPSPSPANHNMQQPSPPPNRPPGNFSPYHPPPPPNYHYGAYPPPPPMTTADDAAAYQGSPYSAEHFSTPAESQPQIQPPPPPPPPQQQPGPPQPHANEPGGPGNKQYDEEGTGEFGGLVSYFSSQREDDLDS
ncbi:uncharacterized protein [Venturia canescens]|uniref:uncharacterized protein isoform X2 n=1 Tax=Venturia canescens TaxID=32260 RepID=UPI001C9CF670|nr:uncharacterized protein LOC122409580 isoform X2 [Venturia canescens]